MDINTICFEKDVVFLSAPKGKTLSPEAKLTQNQIETLAEIEWLLSSMQQLMKLTPEVMDILGTKGQPGGLTVKGWDIWSQTMTELKQQTGVQDISIVLVAEKVAKNAESKKYTGSNADIALLKTISQKVEEVYGPIRKTLEGTEYPQSAEVYKNIPTENRSLGAVIISILGKLNEKLPPQLKSEIKISKLIIEEPSQKNVAAAAEAVIKQIQSSCRAYADLIPKAAITPPKPKPKPTPLPTPEKSDSIKYGIQGSIMPAYALSAGSEDTENRGSVRGSVSGYVYPSEKWRLQINYRGYVDATLDEGLISRQSQDFAAFTMEYSSFVAQLAYAWERFGINEEHLWALGPGYKIKLSDGQELYPFIGGIAGSSFEDGDIIGGGYAGGRYSIMFEDAKAAISFQAIYDLLYRTQIEVIGHRLGGSAAVVWSPASFLQLGITAGVDGKLNVNGSTNFYIGPFVGFALPEFNLKEIFSAPQPTFGGGF